ncbi:MAG: LD-carboxypeptidase [Alphaproteobacteria bacterium]|nr:LD-carboxypeptidase [Alphaproteobacteria bacterium]
MKNLIKPKALEKGDKIACVSLSSGLASAVSQRYQRAKKQVEESFGLHLVEMAHTLDTMDDIYQNPKNRLDDFMNAFLDPSIKGILTTIGGDDTIRLLNLMEDWHFDIIKNNPKVFLGMSDTTVNHFMCLKAGVSSFYSPSLLFGYGENGGIPPYIIENTKKTLFETNAIGVLPQSDFYITEFLDFIEQDNIIRNTRKTSGWKFLGPKRKATGRLIGGCLEVLNFVNGTKLWPSLSEWEDTILFIETSEDKPDPSEVTYFLRNLAAQGILPLIKGILFARPGGEFLASEKLEEDAFIEGYKDYDNAILKVLKEYNIDIPVVTHMDFGHTVPQVILPYGVLVEIDSCNEKVRILEGGVI